MVWLQAGKRTRLVALIVVLGAALALGACKKDGNQVPELQGTEAVDARERIEGFALASAGRGFAEGELDDRLWIPGAHEDAYHTALLPEDQRQLAVAIYLERDVLARAPFRRRGEVGHTSREHPAEKQSTVGTAVGDECPCPSSHGAGASAFELKAHHPQVEDPHRKR